MVKDNLPTMRTFPKFPPALGSVGLDRYNVYNLFVTRVLAIGVQGVYGLLTDDLHRTRSAYTCALIVAGVAGSTYVRTPYCCTTLPSQISRSEVFCVVAAASRLTPLSTSTKSNKFGRSAVDPEGTTLVAMNVIVKYGGSIRFRTNNPLLTTKSPSAQYTVQSSGSSVGAALGVIVGWAVGIIVGSRVGGAVGITDGVRDG